MRVKCFAQGHYCHCHQIRTGDLTRHDFSVGLTNLFYSNIYLFCYFLVLEAPIIFYFPIFVLNLNIILTSRLRVHGLIYRATTAPRQLLKSLLKCFWTVLLLKLRVLLSVCHCFRTDAVTNNSELAKEYLFSNGSSLCKNQVEVVWGVTISLHSLIKDEDKLDNWSHCMKNNRLFSQTATEAWNTGNQSTATIPVLKRPPDQFAVSQLLDGNVCVYAWLGRARGRLTTADWLITRPYFLYTIH